LDAYGRGYGCEECPENAVCLEGMVEGDLFPPVANDYYWIDYATAAAIDSYFVTSIYPCPRDLCFQPDLTDAIAASTGTTTTASRHRLGGAERPYGTLSTLSSSSSQSLSASGAYSTDLDLLAAAQSSEHNMGRLHLSPPRGGGSRRRSVHKLGVDCLLLANFLDEACQQNTRHKIPIRAPNTSDIRIFMYF